MSLIQRLNSQAAEVSQQTSSTLEEPPANRTPETSLPPQSGLSLLDLPTDSDNDWPLELKPAALHGVAGEFVRDVLPETEASEAALLFHFLTFAGAMMGRGRYFPVSGTSHHARLFSVAVGDTSTGRKGTALDCVTHVFRAVDWTGEFTQSNVVSGLTSGAGLVWQGRDPQDGDNSETGGVTDKRLLVVESEFGGVLRVSQRKENDLSAVIRDCWDGKSLRSLAKQQPAKATHPHVSLIGHITREELRSTLSKIDVSNGFANRILWYATRRSKFLPDGGNLHQKDFSDLATRIAAAVEFGQSSGQMNRTDRARSLWHHVYAKLSSPRPGVFGQVTTRAEAQVLRLSMLYALLDKSNEIDVQHIDAAMAVWKYSEESARWAFGASLGNSTADELLLALREVAPNGLTTTEISGLFNRNRRATEIREALGVLQRYGLAHSRQSKHSTQGRPAVVWYAT